MGIVFNQNSAKNTLDFISLRKSSRFFTNSSKSEVVWPLWLGWKKHTNEHAEPTKSNVKKER